MKQNSNSLKHSVWSTNKAHIIKDTTSYHANTFDFSAPFGKSVLGFLDDSKAQSV